LWGARPYGPGQGIGAGRVKKPSRNAAIASGICPFLLGAPRGWCHGHMNINTLVTCIAAATIALAAPAHADDDNTTCTSIGNGITHAQQRCPHSPGHQQAPGTYDGHLLPQGYGGKP
jgi:hypothetical protein